jgi:hypothetical protein
MVERMLGARKPDGASIAAFLKFVVDRDGERAKDCLSTVSSKLADLSEPVVAQLKTDLNPVLQNLLARGPDAPLSLSAQLLAARLGLAQVDPAVIRARFTSTVRPALRVISMNTTPSERCTPA